MFGAERIAQSLTLSQKNAQNCAAQELEIRALLKELLLVLNKLAGKIDDSILARIKNIVRANEKRIMKDNNERQQ